jgi:hypothetical protein
MPETQTTNLSAPVLVTTEHQPTPGTPSWWATWAGKTPLDRLLIMGLVLLVGFFVYSQNEQKKYEREDRNKATETELRVRQEEQERNRQSAADRDKTQREWTAFENDRTRRSIDENTKAVLTFNGNAVRLEAAVNALVRKLPENPGDDPCGLRLLELDWRGTVDGAIADPHLPIDPRRAANAVPLHFGDGANYHDCPRIVVGW